MEEILISWIRKNPAFAEDSDDSYHNRKQMMEFAKHYHKKQLLLHNVVKSLKDKYTNEFWFWLERFESEDDSNRLWWYKKDVMLSTEEMWQEYNRLKTTL